MHFLRPLFAALMTSCLLGLIGCSGIPHSDPLKDWQSLGTLSYAAVPETTKQDVQAFIRTLPPIERFYSAEDYHMTYWEDGVGQHAVVLHTPHDGEYWRYALIYDHGSKRVKVLKYSTGSYPLL
jgi:hypothetical protein